ncbi:DUF2321 domain-containing protein [Actinoplanes octamycinicus]|uniref:DUF2321 domain-containing protein n=1 Tax=Actinoplanes octamycinicus TaxID=135948 RepID=UPI0016218048
MTNTIVTRTTPPAFWGRDGQGDGFRAATVCRRRHEHELSLETYPGPDLGFCPLCGAQVLPDCTHCGKHLRGTSRSVTPVPGKAPAYGVHQRSRTRCSNWRRTSSCSSWSTPS